MSQQFNTSRIDRNASRLPINATVKRGRVGGGSNLICVTFTRRNAAISLASPHFPASEFVIGKTVLLARENVISDASINLMQRERDAHDGNGAPIIARQHRLFRHRWKRSPAKVRRILAAPMAPFNQGSDVFLYPRASLYRLGNPFWTYFALFRCLVCGSLFFFHDFVNRVEFL